MREKNYFEIFDLPIAIDIDEKQLTQAYYKLSMQYHPDRFTLDDDEVQKQAIENTSFINKAFKVLKNRQSRIKYILLLSDVDIEEGKESVPQEFLMEMMDINEAIMEYKMDPNEVSRNNIIKQLADIENELFKQISPFIAKFISENNNQVNLLPLKDYYLKNQYIKNIKNNLNG